MDLLWRVTEPNMPEAGQSPGVYRCDKRRVFTFSLPRAGIRPPTEGVKGHRS